MNRHKFLFGLALLTSSTYATNYCFVDQKHPFHVESNFSHVLKARIDTNPVKGSHMAYTEGTSSVYYSGFINSENSLTGQVGLNFVNLDWHANPRFAGNDYYYGIFSLGWVSHTLDKWRWVTNAGVSFDARTFNFGKSGVYYAFLWGRYQYTPTWALHVGLFGYYGAMNGYLLPVLGFDWKWTSEWDLNVIFPFDLCLNYKFHKHWTTSLVATSFGGPYRFPRRIHDGYGRYDGGIFEVYSNGIEWDIKFKQPRELFVAGIGIGYNTGGWIFVKDHENHHGKYYKFDGAGYGRAFLGFSF